MEASPAEGVEAIELSPAVRGHLAVLQELWLEWIAAIYRGEQERASDAVAGMLDAARRLGMYTLPELSVAAAVRAADLAREGDPERARLGLEASERLEPGRPETAFAAAAVARADGGRIAAFGQTLKGYWRLLGQPLTRSLWLGNLTLWLLGAVLLGGAGFVALQVATRGVSPVQDLFDLFRSLLPPLPARVFAILMLLWPLVLPTGLLWLVLWWAVLMWAYGSKMERAVLALTWVLLALAPVILEQQRRGAAVALSPPVRVLDDVERGRLRGSLFNEFTEMLAILPESPAATHLRADVQQIAGQWARARTLYLDLLRDEPRNAAALVDAGACFFHLGELDRAIEYFRRAAEGEAPSAAALFNLSQTYSDLYRFDEAGAVLSRAQAIDPLGVGRWIQEEESRRVVTLRGGFGRGSELRGALAARWGGGAGTASGSPFWSGALTLPVALGLIVAALCIAAVVGRGRGGLREAPGRWFGRRTDAVRVFLLPGLAEAEEEEWGRAFLVVVVLALLVLLPLLAAVGLALPWSHPRGASELRWSAAVGLTLYALVRLRRVFAGG